MSYLQRFMPGLMLVAGVLACTMFYAPIDPQAALRANFGQELEGPVAQIVVRNWGVLIGLMGLLLTVGAFREPVRKLTLLLAGASKLAFIALVLTLGQPLLQFQVGVAVMIDAVFVLLFAVYLIAQRRSA
ncbi:MAG: hypothetical protein ACK4F7_02745 [Inhella sp.]